MILNKKKIIIILCIFVVYSLTLFRVAQAVDSAPAAEPGSDGDPIVTKSYVDQEIVKPVTMIDTLTAELEKRIAQITTLEQKITELEKGLNDAQGTQGGGSLFKVVELKAGKKIFIGASAEIILRSGTATVISGKYGGLSDLTSGGKDLVTGQAAPLNHLLLASRDDGRGFRITSANAFLLVKGAYAIQ